MEGGAQWMEVVGVAPIQGGDGSKGGD